MKAFFTRTAIGLQPADDAAREALAGVPLGAEVACDVTRPRNIRFHRLYWGLVSAIASSIGAQAETVSDVLKVRTGHVRVIKTKDGLLEFPASIAFSKMDQAQFKAFYDRCCMFICEEWLPHLKASELKTQIEQMVGLPTEEAA